MGSAEQGRWMHRVRFTCVTCGRELDYTEDCDIEIEYKPISGKEGERHQVLKSANSTPEGAAMPRLALMAAMMARLSTGTATAAAQS